MASMENKLIAVREVVAPAAIQHDQLADDEIQFSPEDLITLKAIPLFRRNDREFVSTALKIMYKENLHELRTRVMKKRKNTPTQTKSITPKKLQTLFSLLCSRISDVHNLEDQIDRMQTDYQLSIISKALSMARK